MRILALETSAKAVSAAVTEDGKVLCSGYQDTGLTHSRTLMPIVEAMLKNTGLTVQDCDAVAVAAGLMVCLSLAGLTETTLDDLVLIALSCGVLTLVLDAIILPFLLKYGAEKARVISMITFVAIFGGVMLLGGLARNQIALPQPPAWLLTALPVLLGLLAIGGYLISYFIAQGIYAKKEF